MYNRLRDPISLSNVKHYLIQHLEPHLRVEMGVERVDFTEAEKLSFLPMIFGLMPRAAALQAQTLPKIKPLIREHLASVGIPPDEVLVAVLWRACDNFNHTRPRPDRPRKLGVADLRTGYSGIYSAIREAQHGRCAVCGVRFGVEAEETLDHIVPWRLGYDPADGSNWRLICPECNTGKAEAISSHIFPEFQNWAYGERSPDPNEDRTVSLRTRYLVISHHRNCQHPGCSRDQKQASLHVTRTLESGFDVFDYLTVRCAKHL